MGIPAYFYNIIKTYPNIIKSYNKSLNVSNFYLDSNSIIYDIIHTNKLELQSLNKTNMYHKIIELVIKKIDYYIDFISPNNNVYIAFDGVAPLAKLNHQRERRYKSIINMNESSSSNKEQINTNFITPGTEFMKLLNKSLSQYYSCAINLKEINGKSYNIIFSGTNKQGEGEHKIYEYIRQNFEHHKNTTTVIYGLDADLIILSLNHLHINNQIYLCREMLNNTTQSDVNLSINTDNNKNDNKEDINNEPCIVDIYLLATKIQYNILSKNVPLNHGIIHDYVFLSFFLGNDFMPKFIVLNLRTKGIEYLLKCYKQLLKETSDPDYKSQFILNISNSFERKKINWNIVAKFVEILSNYESNWAFDEYVNRERFCKNINEKISDNIPVLCRDIENYISPIYPNWEERYYLALFNNYNNNICQIKKDSSINFIEGLEWCTNYYSFKCINYYWYYKYDYAPLLIDLIKYIPNTMMIICESKYRNYITENMQLAYVLPKESYDLLPLNIKSIMENFINSEKNNLTSLKSFNQDIIYNNYDVYFNYSYCRYLWEAHLNLHLFDFNSLKNIFKNNNII